MLDPKLRQVVSIRKDKLEPYNRYGDPIPGMSWMPLSGELHNGEFECFILRMDPGAESKPHEHVGFEEFLVMEGELIDCDDSTYRAGDYVRFLQGSKHTSRSPDGCTLLVILRGNNRTLGEMEMDEWSTPPLVRR
ncbi:Cupin domain protein [Luminiphilus syltensis NOR5-1B]|uniref:Cupin domain protein n=1 Tax=Luminiphilus syltensis NOR5-1B TaxID=565045 RepID=B8KXZ4_9GAMM|nr:cupin domain-containing protein [Luminiphilus syltensis]EED35114.1 Cupin domain protein [Luminiphilus syltensis NOR5-1B]